MRSKSSPVGPKKPSEGDIQNKIRIRLSEEPDVILWRNSQGVTRTEQGHYKAGLGAGTADLVGICAGRFVALEVKTDSGKLSAEQALFLELVRSRKGFACVVRSVEEALSAIWRCRQGALE